MAVAALLLNSRTEWQIGGTAAVLVVLIALSVATWPYPTRIDNFFELHTFGVELAQVLLAGVMFWVATAPTDSDSNDSNHTTTRGTIREVCSVVLFVVVGTDFARTAYTMYRKGKNMRLEVQQKSVNQYNDKVAVSGTTSTGSSDSKALCYAL